MAKRRKITDKARKAYLRSGGSICPNCGCADISAGHVEADGSRAWGGVECRWCGATWTDEFRLSGVGNMEVPECEGRPA